MSKVKATFAIYGDDFNINNVSEILNLSPSKTRIKGVVSQGGKIPSPTTGWSLSTEYEDSYDVMDQMNNLASTLKKKVLELKKIKTIYDVKYVFMFSIKIEDGKAPGFYLEGELLSFVNEIDAAIDLDMYIL
ncbi:DUF4279 domain-containing protein [Morganella morganii]|uniref:DUF4279 domain-containing protein n=1 Tax=Morganella morganii TaxID=582 RepID=UPI0015F66840|nr:DUF4279 domain-containing protein [Morganella morganii]